MIKNYEWSYKYTHKFPTNLPHGDKKYTLTYTKRVMSNLVYDMG